MANWLVNVNVYVNVNEHENASVHVLVHVHAHELISLFFTSGIFYPDLFRFGWVRNPRLASFGCAARFGDRDPVASVVSSIVLRTWFAAPRTITVGRDEPRLPAGRQATV